jgi:hypothetical protein
MGALVVLAFAGAHLSARLSPLTRAWVIRALRERYQSDVRLKNLTVALWHHPRVSGEGLVLQPKDRPGFPRLATVNRFSAEATLPGTPQLPSALSQSEVGGTSLEYSAPPSGSGAESPKTET